MTAQIDACPSWCQGDHATGYGHHGTTHTVAGIDTELHLGASLYEGDPGPVTEIILGRTGAMVCLTADQITDLIHALTATVTGGDETGQPLDRLSEDEACPLDWCEGCFEDVDGTFHISPQVPIRTMYDTTITVDSSYSPTSPRPWEIGIELSAGTSAALDRDRARQLGHALLNLTEIR